MKKILIMCLAMIMLLSISCKEKEMEQIRGNSSVETISEQPVDISTKTSNVIYKSHKPTPIYRNKGVYKYTDTWSIKWKLQDGSLVYSLYRDNAYAGIYTLHKNWGQTTTLKMIAKDLVSQYSKDNRSVTPFPAE